MTNGMTSAMNVVTLATAPTRGRPEVVGVLDFHTSNEIGAFSSSNYDPHAWSSKSFACAAALALTVGMAPPADAPRSYRLISTISIPVDATRLKRQDDDDGLSSVGYDERAVQVDVHSAEEIAVGTDSGDHVEDAMTTFNHEWLPKERQLRTAINLTCGLFLLVLVAFIFFGVGAGWFLALIPGAISAFGVVGSCAIQLNKINGMRELVLSSSRTHVET
ncbi:hypothetical protein [Aeromonas sp. MrichA-1]|uniref:hypothetical protein n=2 Tax=Aeromonadaceae TaxID=84642 RepID=UPI001B33BA41|nr:hypothetical protein [Aeromonas sp. MrichA-1]